MILSDVFERFARDSPLSVMAQGVLENALSPRVVDQLFEDVAERQYTRKLLFSSVVDLMGLVVCRIRPAICAAYQARAEVIEASLRAVYDKLDRTEPGISAALVHTTAARLGPVIDAMKGGRPELLPGYHVKILDGNHLTGTEHRIKELRTMRAGALPGQALVVLDPGLMLATDVILCEDGHAQERSLLDQVLETVRAKDLWIEDRNFCTTGFLFGIAGRGAFFVVRQHASTLHWEFAGKRQACGRIGTGQVFQQTIRATDDAGEILILRRVTVVLDRPTRDGETEIHLLTNVPAKDARAKVIAELYRKRWTIETAFAELEATLDGEVNTLGYPKAALSRPQQCCEIVPDSRLCDFQNAAPSDARARMAAPARIPSKAGRRPRSRKGGVNMITSPRKRSLSTLISRHFQFNRFQKQSIASAYEALIPIICRRPQGGHNRPSDLPQSRTLAEHPRSSYTGV